MASAYPQNIPGQGEAYFACAGNGTPGVPYVPILGIGADVVAAGAIGGGVAATGTATAIGAAVATKGVLIKADDDNSGSIYVGLSAAVTANSGQVTSGHRLKAGQTLQVPVSNANLLWVIGSASGQNYTYSAF